MGALAEATIPATKRWIPKGMTVSYTAKAIGDITCIAETDAGQWTCEQPRPAGPRPRGLAQDGPVVIEGVINLWVTAKKRHLSAAAAELTHWRRSTTIVATNTAARTAEHDRHRRGGVLRRAEHRDAEGRERQQGVAHHPHHVERPRDPVDRLVVEVLRCPGGHRRRPQNHR